MTVVVYTDGACKTEFGRARMNANPNFPGVAARVQEKAGKGGWAWWVNDHSWDSGAVPNTTNNRMEMLAVIQVLLTAKVHWSHEPLLIVSDSMYVVNCFADGWYLRWRKSNWLTASGKPVKNRDYWERMLELYENHLGDITFRHCRGHGKGGPADAPYVAGNDKADKLAVAARKTLERGSRHEPYPPDPPFTLPEWMA